MGIKYSVNEDFFNIWSQEMAYVLGYIYADGSIHLSARGSYVSVSSIDKSTISKIKKWLKSRHTIRTQKSTWPNAKIQYVLRIGNQKVYKSLKNLGLYPNKSLSVEFPKNIPAEYMSHFIRGYFDGDGCVYFERAKGKTKKLIIKRLSTIFTGGSKIFLDNLVYILKIKLLLNQSKIYNRKRSFQLRYSTNDSVKLFKFLYKDVKNQVYLKRKFDVFVKYFNLRPIRIDKDIKNILEYMNIGHVVK